MAEQDRNNRSNTIPIIGSEFVRPQPSDLTIIRDTVKHANRNKVTSKHDRWQVYRGSNLDDKIFTVKRSSSVQLKTRVEVFLKQPDKRSVL
ncbi:BnaA05g13190D [Brassica napus]|uniref:BnaA05g13190D protein n=3 Tax=Brassica TaxID=3705 RepID=A0A078F1F4_BRANA|nr:BnaA05g13190D [Brassica napus]